MNIDDQLDRAIDDAYVEAAQAYRNQFQAILRQHNLQNHPVQVRFKTLRIGDNRWWELRPGHPLTDALIAIGVIIDQRDWLARNLEGVEL